jgi:uncharacterized surface protein with fasciclin (FAS1) repeats
MKKTRIYYKTTVTTIILLIMLLGCSKKLDRYKDPDWLGGESIKVLEDAKTYTIFLQLMDKAKNRSTIEKQLSTLFVPDDKAFEKFFQEKGITSVNDLTLEQAQEIFALHYLSQPRNANLLVYEKAWTRLESATGEYGAFFFRKATTSTAPPYVVVPKYDKTYKDQPLFITTGVKYIPLWSKNFFHDYNGDGAVDYPFMYPNSTWGGLMNWHTAMIIPPSANTSNIEDLAHPTASGFIYYIDRVIDAMPSIEQYLIAHQDQYGKFYDLMQRYASYTPSGIDKQGRKLFTKVYTGITNIALEEGPTTGDPMRMANLFTVFMPDDNLLQTYFENTILQGYPSIDSVPDVTIKYILQSQMTNRVEVKSKFTKAFYNIYGDLSVINASDVEPGFVCSNGIVYKSKKILEPNVFICVPGKLFFNKNYSTFLTMLTNAGMITTLSSDRTVTLFAPSNDQLAVANIRLATSSTGTPEIQQMSDAGVWKKISDGEQATFVQDHVYNGASPDLTSDGYIEMYSHNFVHYSGNVISGGLNINKGISASVVSDYNSKNGKLFYISSPIQSKYRMGQYIIMSDPDFSEFASLMVLTGILDLNYSEKDTKNKYPNIAITEAANAFYWTALIPDNAAVKAGILNGSVPDTTGISNTSGANYPTTLKNLKDFVTYHLVQKTIFDDGKQSGSFKTALANYNVTITNSPGNLGITDATGQTVYVNHANGNANHVVRRGVVHKITSVLKYK